jgi:hypothetical protein
LRRTQPLDPVDQICFDVLIIFIRCLNAADADVMNVIKHAFSNCSGEIQTTTRTLSQDFDKHKAIVILMLLIGLFRDKPALKAQVDELVELGSATIKKIEASELRDILMRRVFFALQASS